MTTPLSEYQFAMLRILVETHHLSIGQAQVFDQRAFRSMLVRGWAVYAPGRGFHITKAGRAVWERHQHTEIRRANPFAPLTSYFDPVAYGLDPLRPKLHVLKRAGAA